VVTLLVVVGFLIWSGVTLLLDAWHPHHHRRDLAERLGPYRSHSIVDEAQEWLESQP